MEHLSQQQYVTVEGIDNSNARALVVKLINVVLTVLQVVLLLVATAAGIIMPFLKTRLVDTLILQIVNENGFTIGFLFCLIKMQKQTVCANNAIFFFLTIFLQNSCADHLHLDTGNHLCDTTVAGCAGHWCRLSAASQGFAGCQVNSWQACRKRPSNIAGLILYVLLFV